MSADSASSGAHLEPDTEPVSGLLRALPAGEATAEQVLAELAAVQVAHEELRVAEEELRVQQEQITHLLVQHDAERRWRGQMSALLPIGLCVTDGNGTVTEANPALATHLGAALQRLRGKPLSVYLDPADVRQFRSALRALGSGAEIEERLTVTVHPRRLAPGRCELFGFTETADHRASVARIQWVLVPVVAGTGDQGTDRAADAADAGREPAADASGSEVPIPASQVIGLAASLAELSALPVGEANRQRLLSRMAALIREAVPAADWVSITVGTPQEPQRLGSDSTEAQAFDGRQARAAEGPCWTAFRTGAVVVTHDVTADPRWPALAPLAAAGAVRSVLAVPLHEDGTTTGAVNVYSGQTAAFGSAGRRIAELVAAAVAGVLQNVAEREAIQQLAKNLERALTSRAVIDQAKGMIMARLGVDADDAFARLVSLSSQLNVKVRDLATLVVEGHVDDVLSAGP
ncbi:ANTAR domain-containing protein [Geodermatophilus sp. CPCC 206100]|uniref:ANTAR domain-containing protein n=1 Tax=Geodermatophilus sp. CPCC 206100 TaxID=3020054 RepID=UPI003B00FD05